MDTRHLYYFREIVRQGSISKAAEVLHMAQPPLSQLLKKLESDLGTTLIHRYREKWQLTETGELLYQHAELMLRQMQDVKQRIQEIEQGITGVVNIGVASVCSNILIDYVSVFRTLYPRVKINIMTGNSDELLRKLRQKEIDVALLLRSGSHGQHYLMKSIQKQPFVVIMPTGWLTSMPVKEPTLENLASFPFILLGPMEGHSFHESILEAFHERHLNPNVVIECKDVTMVIELVSRGLGLSIIPGMEYPSPILEKITFHKLEQINLDVEPVFLRLKEEPASKAAVQFWDIVH